MYGHHEHGGWGGGGGWGHQRWGWGGGPFVARRIGYPLFGGFGIGNGGMGMGGGLMGDLLAGGVGYLMGRNIAQNQQQYPSQYQQYPPQYQQYPQRYQQSASQYQAPPSQDTRLVRLNLLGQLRAQGTLTEEEFQAEKQKILNGY